MSLSLSCKFKHSKNHSHFHSNITEITLTFTEILDSAVCTVGGGRLQAGAKSWRTDNAVDSRGDYYTFTPEPRGKFFKYFITFLSKSPEVNNLFIFSDPRGNYLYNILEENNPFILWPQRWFLLYFYPKDHYLNQNFTPAMIISIILRGDCDDILTPGAYITVLCGP